MLEGDCIKSVAEAGVNFIRQKHHDLLQYLPKTFGFGLGLDFRESALLMNTKNAQKFAANMVFNLAVGFHDLPLNASDKANALGSIQKLSKYSMLVSDTVMIRADGNQPEFLTKHSAEWKDVSYFINESGDDVVAFKQDASNNHNVDSSGAILNNRLRERVTIGKTERRSHVREEKQAELMQQKLAAKQSQEGVVCDNQADSASQLSVAELNTFHSTREYPSDLIPNEIYVDLAAQVVFAPINGSPVPFHISMIKNAVQPDPDRTATYLRLNLYTPGQSLAKEVATTTGKLIDQHGRTSTFIKEMLYRSREPRRLTAAYRMIQELRKRFRQHAARVAEEADLIIQEKLVKMRDQRIPRMTDLTMRPFLSGKKTTGSLEAHTNGLRFSSKKHEMVDIMYTNIQHSLFQPCECEVMVLIHFHLQNPILIGKKKPRMFNSSLRSLMHQLP